jgi:hypothetical protein
MIDGFDVDLNTVDSSDLIGTYEQNEVHALYNSDEMKKQTAIEQAKEDAPYIVNYNSGALNDDGTYKASYKCADTESANGIYIKEGKYIGKTSAVETVIEENAEDEVSQEDEVSVADEITENVDIVGDEENIEDSSESEFEGPFEYLRIIINDLDYAIVDNVEDFFDIEDEIITDTSSASNAFNSFDAEVSDDELEMLAAVLVAENGASEETMTAVCQVIKNRGNDTVHFSNVSSIADILTATGQYGTVFPVGDNNVTGHKGGKGTAPNGTYTKIYDLGKYGKFVVGNQASGRNIY